MTAFGCDFNRSMQHIEQSVQPVFDIVASFLVFHLIVAQQRLVGFNERWTGPFLSGSTVVRGRWCFHSTRAARDSVGHRSRP